jgi:hypothetical protein
MDCDDAGGRPLDKYGDVIGEGYKGTNGLGHDKDLRKMLRPHMACPFGSFYWPDGRVGRMRPTCRGGLRARILDEAARFCRVAACGDAVGFIVQWPRSPTPSFGLPALTQNDIASAQAF